MPFESMQPPYDVDDFEDKPYYTLLKRLPPELAMRHLNKVSDMTDGEVLLYLEAVVEARKEALTEAVLSDPNIQRMFEGREAEIYSALETYIFEDHENLIGHGTTARIMKYELSDDVSTIRIAVKYLVTPNEKTLSASGEHDMIIEVERMKHIEELESSEKFEHVSIPHPYFHLKTQKIESYGMQLIDGPNLDLGQIENGNYRFSTEQIEAINNIDLDAVNAELERFFSVMHTYCLHGDIKPRNWMMDADGKFYLIDFGQSILAHEFNDKTIDQFEELKDQELKMSKDIIRRFIDSAKRQIAQY